MPTEEQVWSTGIVDFGKSWKLVWAWGDTIVPKKKMLEITTLTLNYFPSKGGKVGRAGIDGRDAASTAIWRLQCVYVEPLKTVHLVFPKGLKLKAGGYVELSFFDNGPGTITMEATGTLVS
jgi:hypothetical protein